jgi:hypothetical protein
MTWVLILTLMGPATYAGSAVTSIPGFANNSACMAAGQAWLNKNNVSNGPTITALCVRSK